MHSSVSGQRRMKPYRKVLGVSLPLVVSMSSTMIMEFTDRIFLANYSLNAIAAALPAGIAAFLFISSFWRYLQGRWKAVRVIERAARR